MSLNPVFQELYLLNQVDIRIALEFGDCGSWVIDDVTNEVYGHVVASDMFGEVYVVPLKAVLQDIEEQFTGINFSVCIT